MICYVFSTVSAPDDVIISILLCHVHDWNIKKIVNQRKFASPSEHAIHFQTSFIITPRIEMSLIDDVHWGIRIFANLRFFFKSKMFLELSDSEGTEDNGLDACTIDCKPKLKQIFDPNHRACRSI